METLCECGHEGSPTDQHHFDCDYWRFFDIGIRGEQLEATTAFLFELKVDA